MVCFWIFTLRIRSLLAMVALVALHELMVFALLRIWTLYALANQTQGNDLKQTNKQTINQNTTTNEMKFLVYSPTYNMHNAAAMSRWKTMVRDGRCTWSACPTSSFDGLGCHVFLKLICFDPNISSPDSFGSGSGRGWSLARASPNRFGFLLMIVSPMRISSCAYFFDRCRCRAMWRRPATTRRWRSLRRRSRLFRVLSVSFGRWARRFARRSSLCRSLLLALDSCQFLVFLPVLSAIFLRSRWRRLRLW